MVAAEIRQSARNNLTGKWGKAALMTLVYSLIMFGIGFIAGILSIIPLLGFIANIGLYVIEIPLTYGLLVSFMKVKQAEEVQYTDFLTIGFSNFGRAWAVVGNILLKLLLPLVLCIVFIMLVGFSITFGATSALLGSTAIGLAGGFFAIIGAIGYLACLIWLIPKSYLYVLSFYLSYDHPEMTTREVVEESERLMIGHRWSFFFLSLSFIGWAILTCFTFGIGMLWLLPYMLISFLFFYDDRAGKISSENRQETGETTSLEVISDPQEEIHEDETTSQPSVIEEKDEEKQQNDNGENNEE